MTHDRQHHRNWIVLYHYYHLISELSCLIRYGPYSHLLCSIIHLDLQLLRLNEKNTFLISRVIGQCAAHQTELQFSIKFTLVCDSQNRTIHVLHRLSTT